MRRPAGSWGGFTLRTHTLMLVLVIVLAGSAAGAIKGHRQQELMQEGDDTECLKGIVDSVRLHGQEDESSSTLFTWTLTAIRNPCNYTSELSGISCNNSRVASILLPASSLAGNIPSSLSSCYYLHTLDLSSNSLSGPLPPLLGALSFLSVFSLSNNNLSGQIPYELATLASLTYLDLNHNQLSGSIPPQLGLLSLQFFNVSNNKLSGRIPSTLSNTSTGSPRFNASSFANNPNLYGYPLPLYSFSTPPTSYRKGLSAFTIVWIGIVTGLASMTFSLYGVWLYTIVRDRRDKAEKEKERATKRKQCLDEESKEYIGWKEVLERL